jgi:hypothetical protein
LLAVVGCSDVTVKFRGGETVYTKEWLLLDQTKDIAVLEVVAPSDLMLPLNLAPTASPVEGYYEFPMQRDPQQLWSDIEPLGTPIAVEDTYHLSPECEAQGGGPFSSRIDALAARTPVS